MNAVNNLLLESEKYYPEYYFSIDKNDNVSNDLQTDFHANGHFICDQFEIRIEKRGNNVSDIEFIILIFNYDILCFDKDDYENSSEIEPYDMIERDHYKNFIITPFDGNPVYSDQFYEYSLAERIIKLAIETINTFIEEKRLERESKIKEEKENTLIKQK